ncbi:NPCBM/NEW2 domain protein [Rosistilla carotiformis]|uniref:NPCBM/NEW2 domain protein n=1 Tax=Rosistilla carotiformis TaxID=2528017 RepID=A0A518JPZ4_9BACT|nr:NPCBM/NEW2 domain-containing protein [Rosistilla carotiformis]QDV67607.1 NPCBM/NEW2 domain protein [Rosistilla carotiformis]
MAFIGFLLIVAGLGQVTVDSVDGQKIAGNWVAIDETAITIETAGKTEQYPIESVVKLRRNADASPSATAIRVGLVDGSQLRVRSVQAEGKSVTLDLLGAAADDATLDVPLKQVAWIRFRPPVAQGINEQWEQKQAADKPADTLVVRAGSDQLDEIAGTVLAIGRDAVSFDLGGQQVDAPLDRLEGIVFRGSDAEPTKIQAQITDIAGSTWAASKITGQGKTLQLETAAGISRTFALDRIQQIEFRGNVRMLRAADAASVSFAAAIGGLLDPAFSKTLFGPRDVASGIALSAGSELTIRLGDDDRLFETIVETPNRSFDGGVVRLVIQLDDDAALDKKLTAAELPEAIQLDVAGKRRLQIRVESGQDSSTGDALLLRKPRLRK